MTEIYILAIIGYVAIVYAVMKLAIFFMDKFIWKYTEKEEKKMIHDLLTQSIGRQLQEKNNRDVM